MASSIDSYTLKWDYHANNFPINLMDLLNRKEFIDVQLVADGHLFNAHRLILSALSPYFQRIFTQMPANQQAFVFLKDVPKEAVEQLITFIYSGEVNVKHENLEDFLSVAKSLDIKGLTDESCTQTSNIQPSASNLSSPTYKAEQYQSTRSIHVPCNPAKIDENQDQSNRYQQPVNTFDRQQTDSQFEETNDFNRCVSMNDYGSDNGNVRPLNQDDAYGAQNDPWYLKFCAEKNFKVTAVQPFKHEDGALNEADSIALDDEIMVAGPWNFDHSLNAAAVEPDQPIPNVFKSKRAKMEYDPSAYDRAADIRTNSKGLENLYFGEYKFNKHGKQNLIGQQRWQCTKQASRKCMAAVKTMPVDGVLKMKVLVSEHVH